MRLRVQAVNLYEDAMRVDYVLPPEIDRDAPENSDSTSATSPAHYLPLAGSCPA
jgi:hypothetical protein